MKYNVEFNGNDTFHDFEGRDAFEVVEKALRYYEERRPGWTGELYLVLFNPETWNIDYDMTFTRRLPR